MTDRSYLCASVPILISFFFSLFLNFFLSVMKPNNFQCKTWITDMTYNLPSGVQSIRVMYSIHGKIDCSSSNNLFQTMLQIWRASNKHYKRRRRRNFHSFIYLPFRQYVHKITKKCMTEMDWLYSMNSETYIGKVADCLLYKLIHLYFLYLLYIIIYILHIF